MRKISRNCLWILAVVLSPAATANSLGKLVVSASVVTSCKLSVDVPKVGSAERRQGGIGTFSATCTRGALASAMVGGEQHAIERSQVRTFKGITLPSGQEHLASADDHRDTTVTEVLF